MVNYYSLSHDEELDIYTVRKQTKTEDKTYTLRLKPEGGFAHECKATSVYGDDYLCRHKKLILNAYFIKDKNLKKKFNLTNNKNKK